MDDLRRQLIRSGLGLTALGSLPVARLGAQTRPFSTDPFTLGVASGYPEPNAVVLWTRLAPEPLAPGGGMSPDIVPVDWEVASDDRFGQIVRSGRDYATADWAHSVHVEVTGLEPGRPYWYRFRAGDVESLVGRTSTAPRFNDELDRFRIGVANCQHYESGHYAAYRAMAEDELDLIVHLGDYIYENRGLARVRQHSAPEPYTLDDYRLRYAIYKSDALLQRAHASCTWLATWDDHEVDNDYADRFSENDDSPELFLARRAGAYQAYYEHMPLPRRLIPFGANQRLHTRQRFGRLLDVILLDGRQYRSDQACAERLAYCDELFASQRTMLGQAQEAWLDRQLRTGSAGWNLFAQQTVFAHMDQAEGEAVGYWADGWSGYPAARQRFVDGLRTHETVNPVILSGDVHGFFVNDIHARSGDIDSSVTATEIVSTSISSNGPPQDLFDQWHSENPNVHFARSDRRGYSRLTLTGGSLQAELMAVDDITREDSPVSQLASFEIEAGRPGISF